MAIRSLPKTTTQRETGNRMIGWGAHFQVSGLSDQEPGSGDQVQVRVQEIRPLSSIQPCFHFGWRVTASGGRWRDFSIQPSTQSSTQPSIQSSHFATVIRHLSSIQPSIQLRYVVTRSRPYPARRSREVEAVSGWRLGTQPRQTRAARGAVPTSRHALPLYSILDTLSILPTR